MKCTGAWGGVTVVRKCNSHQESVKGIQINPRCWEHLGFSSNFLNLQCLLVFFCKSWLVKAAWIFKNIHEIPSL